MNPQPPDKIKLFVILDDELGHQPIRNSEGCVAMFSSWEDAHSYLTNNGRYQYNSEYYRYTYASFSVALDSE